MATVTISITSTTYGTARSASVEAGVDYLNITAQEASSGALYGLNGNSVSISGCSYTRYAVGSKYVYSLSGYPSSDAVGTHTLGMARITSTGTKSTGANITLTIGNYYYSTLKYDANTGSGAPDTQQDKSEIVTAQPSAYTHTISNTTPMLSGYEFKGWSTTQYAPGTGTAQYQPGGTITVSYSMSSTSGATLYAVWGINIDGGIQWVKDDTTKTLTIKPTDTPETGYTSGQMKDYTAAGPWGTIADSGWTLTLEDGITSIGNYAFKDCSGFTGSLTIPDSVTSIGISAFAYCSRFTGSLTIPAGVTSIGHSAFYGCTGFTGSLTIPDSVTSIGNNAFRNCSGFTGSLTIPAGVTSIGNYVFFDCFSFTGPLVIPDSVTSIGNYAFKDCSGFTGSLTIPNSVTSIGIAAFAYCSRFTGSLTIPDSVTSIGDSAFYRCTGFTGSLTIPNSVTTIDGNTFQGCSGFTEVKFLGDQPTLGANAFNLNISSPEKTYSVYSNGWANATTFPEFTYTKWNYHKPIHIKVNGSWVSGTPFVKVDGVWKQGTPYIKVDGEWK